MIMAQVTDYKRSEFLRLLGTGAAVIPKTLEGIVDFSVREAKAYEKVIVKNVQESEKYKSIALTEKSQIDDYVRIKRGMNQLEKGINAGFYGRLSDKFVGLSENASLRYATNPNDADLALRIMALAHAGFSSMKAAGFLNYDESNLDKAHLMYRTALQLRRQLDVDKKKQIQNVYIKGDEAGINFATEELLIERVAETLSYLYDRKTGSEREAMRRRGKELYLNLLAKTENAKTENSIQIGHYKKGLKRLGYLSQSVSK